MKTQKLSLNRLQLILAGVLILQILLAVVVNLPRRIEASGGPLLEGYDPATTAEIWIENQSGDQLHIQKIDGEWVIPEKGNYPIRAEKVAELLEKVKGVQTNRMVTQTETSHSQLLVAEDDFMNKIILIDANGNAHILFLGTSSGAGATHIRRSGHNQVFLTSDLTSWEVSPAISSWIDTAYLNLNQDQIQSINVQNSNGAFNFTKGTDGQWVFDALEDGEEFDVNAFQNMIGSVVSLQMLEPLGMEERPSWGFDESVAAVSFVIQDESQSSKQVTLNIGRLLGSDYAVKASNSPYYVKVSPTYISSLLEMDHSNLLVAEPTPTPESEP